MTTFSNPLTTPDRIDRKTGHGGLRYLELRVNGAVAHLYLHGAHVLHYQPAAEPPVLWHSQASAFEPGKPIRGGIPICWPWFGAHPNDSSQPSHGVARLAEWNHIGSSVTPDATSVTLELPAACYPGASVQLTAELSDRLSVSLATTNTGKTAFHFTEALHSYFSVQDIRSVLISGLDGQRYIDQLAASKTLRTQAGTISFSAETDRIYTDAPHACTVMDPLQPRSIHIRKENSRSTVVWNPWIDKSTRMPDFGDHEYLNMVCVETANCGPDAVSLAPGQTHTLHLHISTQPE